MFDFWETLTSAQQLLVYGGVAVTATFFLIIKLFRSPTKTNTDPISKSGDGYYFSFGALFTAIFENLFWLVILAVPLAIAGFILLGIGEVTGITEDLQDRFEGRATLKTDNECLFTGNFEFQSHIINSKGKCIRITTETDMFHLGVTKSNSALRYKFTNKFKKENADVLKNRKPEEFFWSKGVGPQSTRHDILNEGFRSSGLNSINVFFWEEPRKKQRTKTKKVTKKVVKPKPITKADLPTTAIVPGCGLSWKVIDIPRGWYIELGLSEEKVRYSWRNMERQWGAHTMRGLSGVRFCAREKKYIGESMPISWRKY